MTRRLLELAFPSERWARHVADALTDAGWLSTVVVLDGDHVHARRPDLAELLPDDLLVCWLVLAAPPMPLELGHLDAGAFPTAEDRCARCPQPIDHDAGPVKLGGEWLHRDCLNAEEAECILDRPPPPADPRDGTAGDA